MEDRPDPDPSQDWRQILARHPFITATMVLCTLGGAVAGVVFLSGD
jgi:hypothetical protein